MLRVRVQWLVGSRIVSHDFNWLLWISVFHRKVEIKTATGVKNWIFIEARLSSVARSNRFTVGLRDRLQGTRSLNWITVIGGMRGESLRIPSTRHGSRPGTERVNARRSWERFFFF